MRCTTIVALSIASQAWAVPMDAASLNSYFDDGAGREAKVAFDAGKYTQAATLLQGAADTPSRFLRALALHRMGDFRHAAPQFESLATDYSALGPRCWLLAALGYEKLAQWDNASRAFSQVESRSRLFSEAQLGQGRALMRQRNFKGALSAIAELTQRPAPPWGRDLGAEALLLQADVFAAQKKTKAERDALFAVWSTHPMTAEADTAAARLGAREKPVDAVVARAEALLDAHRNAQAVALVEPQLAKLKMPGDLACRATFVVGKGYRKMRQHTKAAAVLSRLAPCADAELRARALFTLGFSQSIAQPEAAAATYESLAKLFPQHSLADDALYFAAQAYQQQGDKVSAERCLHQVAQDYASGDYAAEALFRLFWSAREDERWDDAHAALAQLETSQRDNVESHDFERALYWRGRAWEQHNDLSQALSSYETLALAHPTTYYGLLARERVAALEPARGAQLLSSLQQEQPTQENWSVEVGPLSEDVQFQSAVELTKLRLGAWVPLDVLAVERSALSPEQVRLLVTLLSVAGEERAAHGLARLWLKRELTGPVTAESRALWVAAYPKVYRDLVSEYAQQVAGLDVDLLQALMREESGLNPEAHSWAGALGLCQLMPKTAADVATSLKLKAPKPAELLNPQLNVRLGARYLSDLLQRAQGITPFALASYNAGESSVSRWRKEYGDGDLAAWVEQIPLQETRGYVKRVLRSYNTYKLLYSPGLWAATVTPLAAGGRSSASR